VIREVVMLYVRFPLSLRNVEDLLFERGYDLCHETVRLWWNRFGPLFAGEIRRRRVSRMRGFRHWRWHLDEVYVKLNGEMVYLWRAVDHEGEILESFVTGTRDKEAALRFMKKALTCLLSARCAVALRKLNRIVCHRNAGGFVEKLDQLSRVDPVPCTRFYVQLAAPLRGHRRSIVEASLEVAANELSILRGAVLFWRQILEQGRFEGPVVFLGHDRVLAHCCGAHDWLL